MMHRCHVEERFDAVDHGLVAGGMEQVERVLTAGQLGVND